MSANNELRIKKKNKLYILEHWDIDCGKMNDKFPEFSNLEDAIKEANRFMENSEYGVEYGLNIKI